MKECVPLNIVITTTKEDAFYARKHQLFSKKDKEKGTLKNYKVSEGIKFK